MSDTTGGNVSHNVDYTDAIDDIYSRLGDIDVHVNAISDSVSASVASTSVTGDEYEAYIRNVCKYQNFALCVMTMLLAVLVGIRLWAIFSEGWRHE